MCGITALYEPTAPAWLGQVVRAMTQLVRHRGPDGEGFVFFGPDGRATPVISDDSPAGIEGPRQPAAGAVLGFGHRRLSILDLSAAGHQPMADAKGGAWIVFNGEIYNYAELRTELAPLGHVFRTGTDTEVILAAWRQWGTGCLERFNGMFAFVLLDTRTRHLFAARDRFGVKPLYYWPTPTGGLALVSEIKQLLAHPQWRAQLNGQMAYEFVNWKLTDHTADTLFAGVRQLRGGEYFDIALDDLARAARNGTGLAVQRWYELKPKAFSGSMEDAARRLRELLQDSIFLRLRADVPVGSCLSGGLDSSSIVCTLRHLLGSSAAGRQKTISAYSDVARFDERVHAQAVVSHTGVDAHSVIPDPDELLRELPRITWHQDEPFTTTSIFAQWCVFRKAREAGAVVMLDGQGADEALGGYHTYFGPWLAGLLARGRVGEFWRESGALRRAHGISWTTQGALIADEVLPPSVTNPLRRLAGRTVAQPEFLDLDRMGAQPSWPHARKAPWREAVRSFGLAQFDGLSLPMLLHWEDRDSMAHGVEARLPFLDYRLVEFCLGLPEEYKIADGWTKRVLREGMRGVLPESVRLRRDKLGFATAEEVWMRDTRRDEFLRLAQRSLEAARGLVTPEAWKKITRMLSGEERFNFQLWRLISFGAWLERFAVHTTRA